MPTKRFNWQRHVQLQLAGYLLIVFLMLSLADAAEPLKVVVGGDRAYPPYEFIDQFGEPSGYNVELTQAIADAMGMKVEFRLGAWEDMRQALDAGEIDILQGMSYSATRAQQFDFSYPHTIIHHSVFGRAGAAPVDSFQSLVGKEVAVHRGGIIHDEIIAGGYGIKLVPSETQADALASLAAGKHDYAIAASLPATYFLKDRHITNIFPVTKNIASVHYCYAVKKGNTELLARFNEGLAILKKTGQYDAIHNKWLGVLEPHVLQWKEIVKYSALLLTPFLLILAGTLIWSRTLQKQVALRTADLKREIEERERAVEKLQMQQQQLIQADKMASLGVLVSGVAHEINNPNALILLNMPMLAETFRDAEPIFDYYYHHKGDFTIGGLSYEELKTEIPYVLQEMHEGSRRIKRIVDDLKDFARLQDESLSDRVDLNTIVEAAVRLVNKTVTKSTNRFDVHYATALPAIVGNAQRIEQVVVNLILNACQALPSIDKGIFLWTATDESRSWVILTIRDEGCGIPQEHLSRLTDPFFTTKRDSGGTGLGLSVSAGIIKEHGGRIEFRSEIGVGTTVTVFFPAASEACS
jgi:polar amino acid transport system substrate-binding protein